MTQLGTHDEPTLRDVITRELPLGPPFTEAFIGTSPRVFAQLYDATNHIHRSTRMENPSYIVGRKGSGKTAFLIGAALADGAEVVPIQSVDIFTLVERLRMRYAERNGPLVADGLVHVWEVLLFHAALWAIACSERFPTSHAKKQVWTYMCGFGDPTMLEPDQLLARVSAELTRAVIDAPDDLAFREACWSIDLGRGSLADVAAHARTILALAGSDALYVVVDNLEDLHKRLDDFEHIITALFRVTSRGLGLAKRRALPFRTRFAFPAELLPRLRVLAANPEKDFLDYLIIRWTAAELIVVAGNRLRTFLDLHFPKAPARLGLPRLHDHADRDAAEATLRAVLPAGEVRNSLGQAENPVAFVMRHTQLLPRHLILILNNVVRSAIAGVPGDGVPRATSTQVIEGVDRAQRTIVEGILATYSYDYPKVGDALAAIKNHGAPIESVSGLHRTFNRASVARVGIDFEGFLDACLTVGALGVVTRDAPIDRYVVGEFAYTFAADMRPVEDRDHVCVHPLFMRRWFDQRAIEDLAAKGVRAVYPYGSDPTHNAHEF